MGRGAGLRKSRRPPPTLCGQLFVDEVAGDRRAAVSWRRVPCAPGYSTAGGRARQRSGGGKGRGLPQIASGRERRGPSCGHRGRQSDRGSNNLFEESSFRESCGIRDPV